MHQDISSSAAMAQVIRLLEKVRIPIQKIGSTIIRTSFPVACANV